MQKNMTDEQRKTYNKLPAKWKATYEWAVMGKGKPSDLMYALEDYAASETEKERLRTTLQEIADEPPATRFDRKGRMITCGVCDSKITLARVGLMKPKTYPPAGRPPKGEEE